MKPKPMLTRIATDLVSVESTVKRFSGHRSYEQIRAECEAQGLILEDVNYRENGSDWIGVRGRLGGTLVLYSSPTGRFHGKTDTGQEFTEGSDLDGQPWFDALLGFFFYYEEVASHG